MKIVHVFRAPVGGLFRHVRDVARGQAQLGHEVGAICDSTTGDELAEQRLEELGQFCSLGVARVVMPRLPGIGDISSARRVAAAASEIQPDILHGHGAKGGAYARLAGTKLKARSVYTPHGGVLHYEWRSPQGFAFLAAERFLLGRTDGLCFVCEFERRSFAEKIGLGACASDVVHNGLWDEEFTPVPLETGAPEVLFIGELRALKGVDELLEALAILNKQSPVRATITGAGAQADAFKSKAHTLGLSKLVNFTGALPARDAFAKGWLMVVPSRAESFPYIVLEALAAGKPMLATDVGGIGEVLPAENLLPPRQPEALAQAISKAISEREAQTLKAEQLAAKFSKTLSAGVMSEKICGFYRQLLR